MLYASKEEDALWFYSGFSWLLPVVDNVYSCCYDGPSKIFNECHK